MHHRGKLEAVCRLERESPLIAQPKLTKELKKLQDSQRAKLPRVVGEMMRGGLQELQRRATLAITAAQLDVRFSA